MAQGHVPYKQRDGINRSSGQKPRQHPEIRLADYGQHPFGCRPLDSTHHLELKEGQTYLLGRPAESCTCVQITCQGGMARITASLDATCADITLAFCGGGDGQWLRLPQGVLLLEAVKDCQLHLHYADTCPVHHDLLMQWLMALHLVRHPVGAEARLIALFQLLVMHFGIRRSDGYLLPLAIAHSRMAELIGATRSTVTRQINMLRQQGSLSVDAAGSFLLSADLIETNPLPRLL